MHKVIGKIEKTMLGFEHGILTATLSINYGGAGQGIGGYVLANSDLLSPAGKWITRVLLACGVESWEQLQGRTIYVLKASEAYGAETLGIENLPTEPGERFLFEEWSAAVRKAGK
jgi:hypothetical protein